MSKTKKEKLVNTLLFVLTIISLLVVIFNFTFRKVVVVGNSMKPSIDDGAKGYMVSVGKLSKIERFDVVAATYNENGDYIIKRVLGLPNESVKLINNTLYVNEIKITQDFSFVERSNDFPINEWTLKDDEYLLVGDNRVSTIYPKVVTKDDILAKNGFVTATYDIFSDSCGKDDYSSCQIDNRKWYWFKYGK